VSICQSVSLLVMLVRGAAALQGCHSCCSGAACLLRHLSLQQYVPLFLCKEDLDVAVSAAYRQRNAAQIDAQKDKAALAEQEYQEAAATVGVPARLGRGCKRSLHAG